jgi:hypothetical protein
MILLISMSGDSGMNNRYNFGGLSAPKFRTLLLSKTFDPPFGVDPLQGLSNNRFIALAHQRAEHSETAQTEGNSNNPYNFTNALVRQDGA